MTLQDFIEKYDFQGSIVLLEGKRDVRPDDEEKLRNIGKILASRTNHIVFRSGNADGSDGLFAEGVIAADRSRLEVIVPYTKHRTRTNHAYKTYSLEDVNLLNEPEVVYQSKKNKKTEGLIGKYVSGARDRFSIKAAYIIRDTIKAIGTKDIKPATFGIFYDDLSNPRQGGTGHTMKTCELNGIAIVDQRTWMRWIDDTGGV